MSGLEIKMWVLSIYGWWLKPCERRRFIKRRVKNKKGNFWEEKEKSTIKEGK